MWHFSFMLVFTGSMFLAYYYSLGLILQISGENWDCSRGHGGLVLCKSFFSQPHKPAESSVHSGLLNYLFLLSFRLFTHNVQISKYHKRNNSAKNVCAPNFSSFEDFDFIDLHCLIASAVLKCFYQSER